MAFGDGGDWPLVIYHRNLGGELQISSSYKGGAVHYQAADFGIAATAVED